MKRIAAIVLSLVCVLGLAACGKEAPAEAPKVYTTAQPEAMAQAGAFSEELEALDSDVAFALYKLADAGLSQEDLTEAAVLRSSGATCEEAAVLVLADEAKAETAKAALEAYVQAQIDANRDYRPGEIPKLESAQVRSAGSTLLLVVANDMKAAESVL